MRSQAVLAVLLFAALAGCARQSTASPVETDSALAQYVAAQAESGAAAWNRGDLTAFLAPYADSVVVVYPDGPIVGRDRLVALQRANVEWNGVPAVEQASRGASRMHRIAPDDALQIAEIVLRRTTGAERRLWATVLWHRTRTGWRVVHEQSF